MPEFRATELLELVHFLRDLEREDLLALTRKMREEIYEADEIIERAGSPVHALYFILKGGVKVLDPLPEGGFSPRVTLEPGDVIGEMELVLDEPWIATLQAVGETILLRWRTEDVLTFLNLHPEALEHMRFAAESIVLSRQIDFSWLGEDEVVYGLARKHRFFLLQGEALPVVLLAIAATSGWWAYQTGLSLFGWLGAGVALVGLALSVWQWIDWRNDYYIVTDRRAVWLEKVVAIYDSRREAPLRQVLSVSVSTDVIGRLLDYGDVIIRTFTSQVVFRNCKSPRAMAALVEEHWHRVQMQKDEQDQEAKAAAVRTILVPEETPAILEPDEPVPPAAPPKPPASRPAAIGLGRWNFLMRFEERGVITYRKHWAVLLQGILLPSIAVLIVVGLLALRAAGMIRVFSTLWYTLGVLLLLVPTASWWAYEFVDWANDIYQVTPTHIIDIYKKPLARELRKVAPLENILGTEVDRKGIVGLILNYGTVTANVGTARFDFDGVFDPIGVQEDINRAIEAYLEQKREGERRQREVEMVEWLNVYHEEIGGRTPLPTDDREDQ